jgi:hypothetical protein
MNRAVSIAPAGDQATVAPRILGIILYQDPSCDYLLRLPCRDHPIRSEHLPYCVREVKHPQASRRTHADKAITHIVHRDIVSAWTDPIKGNALFDSLSSAFASGTAADGFEQDVLDFDAAGVEVAQDGDLVFLMGASFQLAFGWSQRPDLNRGPTDYESANLMPFAPDRHI